MQRFLKLGALTVILLLLSTLVIQWVTHSSNALATSPPGRFAESAYLLQTTTDTTTTDTTTTDTTTTDTTTTDTTTTGTTTTGTTTTDTTTTDTTTTGTTTTGTTTTNTTTNTTTTGTTTTGTTTTNTTTTGTTTTTTTTDLCARIGNSLYLHDQNNNRYPNNNFPFGQSIYLSGLEPDSDDGPISYAVTNQSGAAVASGTVSYEEDADDIFSRLLLASPAPGQYTFTATWTKDVYTTCTQPITLAVAAPPTVTPEPPTVTPVPPTVQPKEPEPDPDTKIVSIELQVANGKIWGLLVVENPRAGRSVTLALEYRVPAPRLQQEGEDGFTPTGQTTKVAFNDDQTTYNFSFDKPPNTPDNAEYRVVVADADGKVSGTNTTSLPVSFDRPASVPTGTPQQQSPDPTQAAQATASASPAATQQDVLGASSPEQAGGRQQVLPQSGTNGLVLMWVLALVTLIFVAAAGLLHIAHRPQKE